MKKELKYKVEDSILFLKDILPSEAGKLWLELKEDLGENLTNKIYTNYIIGQKEYSLSAEIDGNKIIRVWID